MDTSMNESFDPFNPYHNIDSILEDWASSASTDEIYSPTFSQHTNSSSSATQYSRDSIPSRTHSAGKKESYDGLGHLTNEELLFDPPKSDVELDWCSSPIDEMYEGSTRPKTSSQMSHPSLQSPPLRSFSRSITFGKPTAASTSTLITPTAAASSPSKYSFSRYGRRYPRPGPLDDRLTSPDFGRHPEDSDQTQETKTTRETKETKLPGKKRGRKPRVRTQRYTDERLKRQRERNRLAAETCRRKQKVWMDKLEIEATRLETNKDSLIDTLARLRNEMLCLKEEVLQRAGCDCKEVKDYVRSDLERILAQ